jgi:glycosyltransferase involved in cell wall biosynthesis
MERFNVIPNGAELPAVTPRASGGEPSPLILSVGRLERYKGHHRAIAALPWLLHHVPDARLVVLGSGPDETRLRRLSHDLGVSRHVDIKALPTADRLGMAQQMAGASLVVLLSDYESQGIAALEAMALGRPVLVADTSALSELSKYETVRAIPLGSTPQQVAAAMLEQLRSRSPGSRVELPSWDDCAARIVEVYRAARSTSRHVPA